SAMTTTSSRKCAANARSTKRRAGSWTRFCRCRKIWLRVESSGLKVSCRSPQPSTLNPQPERIFPTMKWVLNTYQTAQDWETDRIIAVCQAAGYEGIEFLQDFKQVHGLEADAPNERLLAAKEKMKAAGLITSSLTSCCFFHEPEEADRRRNIEQVK